MPRRLCEKEENNARQFGKFCNYLKAIMPKGELLWVDPNNFQLIATKKPKDAPF
jgi:hypothetical protein